MIPGFKIADGYAFAARHGLAAEAEAIRNMVVHPSIKRGSAVRKGALAELFESRGIMEQFVQEHWPARHTPAGEKRRAILRQRKNLNDRRLAGEPTLDEVDDETDQPALFALEAHLRDFIASNLPKVPVAGRRLQLFSDDKGRRGVEYPTAVGPIDIVAIDPDGNFFVFELKLQRGPDRALGQLARYMGWVKVEMAAGKKVTGIVVANAIDMRLRYAAAVWSDVVLLEYEMDFRIKDVQAVQHSDRM